MLIILALMDLLDINLGINHILMVEFSIKGKKYYNKHNSYF